jgi:hypothetical protein
MALRAWTEGDLRLALRLLAWASPEVITDAAPRDTPSAERRHQTRQATGPAWRWQMAA